MKVSFNANTSKRECEATVVHAIHMASLILRVCAGLVLQTVCPSVRPSGWINSVPTGQILMKLSKIFCENKSFLQIRQK